MHDYEYRAEVLDIAADGLTHFRIDLGFRVYSDQSLPLVDPPAIRPGDRVHLLIRHEDDGRVIARVRDPSLLGFPRLWQYPGTLVRVVDGDTLDARVTIYPGLAIEERFRLCRVCAPEIFGKQRDSPQYLRGVAARDYVIDRFRQSDGRMILHTSRRGKWRRWLAEVFVGESEVRLNDELLRAGLAVLWFQVPPKSSAPVREPILHDDDLRRELSTRATGAGLSPDEFVRRALDHYLRAGP